MQYTFIHINCNKYNNDSLTNFFVLQNGQTFLQLYCRTPTTTIATTTHSISVIVCCWFLDFCNSCKYSILLVHKLMHTFIKFVLYLFLCFPYFSLSRSLLLYKIIQLLRLKHFGRLNADNTINNLNNETICKRHRSTGEIKKGKYLKTHTPFLFFSDNIHVKVKKIVCI